MKTRMIQSDELGSLLDEMEVDMLLPGPDDDDDGNDLIFEDDDDFDLDDLDDLDDFDDFDADDDF